MNTTLHQAEELPKGYTRPEMPEQFLIKLSDELLVANCKLPANEKIVLITKSKGTQDTPVRVDNSVQVFVTYGNKKRAKWTPEKPIHDYDHPSRISTVPKSAEKSLWAALKD